ncbi:hypothetical protein [Brachybacterium saurashtrense]|uniref:ABC transporter permease n=1 Tax=Brachybacterium saurashtrense TaxID=556288 RepID=A0A345YKD1_9MICO|nr:hypothetical protein [Brachybacterium saurashtrense]AXK44383.1 hypothetical protein DWV08_01265 [Brachybacterium saurashtrense]RRR22994.1 hypothetical protein DXU92_06395 [Brachybacterium saurashtrense]
MTPTRTHHPTASPTEVSPAEERRVGLAVRTELRLNAGRVATTLIACAAVLLWASISTDRFAGVLTLWAALAWYRYGRADTIERDELRASLGLSRADRVRGRVVVVLAEQAAVILTVAASAAVSVLLGRETAGGAAPFSFSGDPSGSQLWIVLAGTLFSTVVLLATGMAVGGDCTRRRPGRSVAVLSVLTYFVAGVLLSIPLLLMMIVLNVDPWDGTLGTPVTAAVLVVAALLLLLGLRARTRRWIRELDSTSRAVTR